MSSSVTPCSRLLARITGSTTQRYLDDRHVARVPHAERRTLGLQRVLRDHPRPHWLAPSRRARTSSTCGVEVPVEVPVDREPHLGRRLNPTHQDAGAHGDQRSTVGGHPMVLAGMTVEATPAPHSGDRAGGWGHVAPIDGVLFCVAVPLLRHPSQPPEGHHGHHPDARHSITWSSSGLFDGGLASQERSLPSPPD